MALIKKIDVEEYFAARRAMRLGRIGLLSKSSAAGTGPVAKKSVPAPVEALTSGHSSPSDFPASIPILSDSGRNRLLRPPGSRQQ